MQPPTPLWTPLRDAVRSEHIDLRLARHSGAANLAAERLDHPHLKLHIHTTLLTARPSCSGVSMFEHHGVTYPVHLHGTTQDGSPACTRARSSFVVAMSGWSSGRAASKSASASVTTGSLSTRRPAPCNASPYSTSASAGSSGFSVPALIERGDRHRLVQQVPLITTSQLSWIKVITESRCLTRRCRCHAAARANRPSTECHARTPEPFRGQMGMRTWSPRVKVGKDSEITAALRTSNPWLLTGPPTA